MPAPSHRDSSGAVATAGHDRGGLVPYRYGQPVGGGCVAGGVATVWVPVDDMDRAVEFYREVLGLDLVDQQPQWSELDANGLTIG